MCWATWRATCACARRPGQDLPLRVATACLELEVAGAERRHVLRGLPAVRLRDAHPRVRVPRALLHQPRLLAVLAQVEGESKS